MCNKESVFSLHGDRYSYPDRGIAAEVSLLAVILFYFIFFQRKEKKKREEIKLVREKKNRYCSSSPVNYTYPGVSSYGEAIK